jgi:uncharacterized protein (DUF983 family)
VPRHLRNDFGVGRSVHASSSHAAPGSEGGRLPNRESGKQRMSARTPTESVRFWPAIWRAVRRKCSRCGEGKLFRSYLQKVERCRVCGEEFGRIHADDGPAWLTIGIIGHVVVPTALFAETHSQWPLPVSMSVWPLSALALTLAVLPAAKAAFVAAIWVTKAPGID